jgi:cellulose synthase/poly-beta-1,6-N-acetylglucosamine synthase-like glycosyltransferase
MVPASNEEGSIGACLRSVREQDYPALQIVVVDGASTDATAAEVRAQMAADPRIELVANPRRNIPSSLNLALEHARGRWLVRVDAHSTVPPGYVRLAVDRLREGRWGGVGGRKDGIGRTPAGRAIAVAMASRLGVGNSTYHFGTTPQEVDHLPFGAYPVEVVRGIGGWDETLTANVDFEFDYRLRAAGQRLLFEPRMAIQWHCRQSLPDLFRQYHRYGRGKADVAWLHPRSMQPRHLAPPAFVVYLALDLLFNARRPGRLLLVLAPYLAAVGVESVRTGRQLASPRERIWLPGAFVAMHLGWGLGFWSGVRRTLPGRLRQPGRTSPWSTSTSMEGSGAEAGPRTTEPSLMENSLP